MAQWVKNSIAAARVTSETQVQSLAQCNGLKDLALLQLKSRFSPRPGNFHMVQVQQGRKEGRKGGREGGRKEGRKGGRKKGRKKERKKERNGRKKERRERQGGREEEGSYCTASRSAVT